MVWMVVMMAWICAADFSSSSDLGGGQIHFLHRVLHLGDVLLHDADAFARLGFGRLRPDGRFRRLRLHAFRNLVQLLGGAVHLVRAALLLASHFGDLVRYFGDLERRLLHFLAALVHLAHDVVELGQHVVKTLFQFADLVARVMFHSLGQVAFFHLSSTP